MSGKQYRSYRTSSSDLRPDPPTHWRDEPLWTMFTRVARKGFGHEQLLSVYRDHGVVPKASRDDNFNRASDDLDSYQLVEPGDLAVNKMKAWQGSLSVSGMRGIVSPAYFIYKAHHNHDSRFIHHLLRSEPLIAVYRAISSGIRVAQWDLDPWAFSRLKLPMPPLREQVAIADYLDRETAQIDTLIAKQEQLIQSLKERRASVVDACLSSASARAVQLRRVLSRVDQGISPQADAFPATEPDELGVLKSGCVNRGAFREHENKSLPLDFPFDAELLARPGDLLVSRASGSPDLVGSAAIVESVTPKLLLSDKLFRLSPVDHIEPRYLYWFLNSRGYRVQVRHAISGAEGLANNLPLSALKGFGIPLPPLDEQRRIVAYLDEQTAKIDTLIAKAERFIELAKERRAALITAAVTGQLDVTAA